jgi:hypothetical protein
MAKDQAFTSSLGSRFGGQSPTISRQMIIAAILSVALLAFEIFNFDTTQYALRDLLGDVRFVGIMWATILAIAFCAIDFAGLVRIVTPQRGAEEPKVVWFLTGAWFLGTLANAMMTWWAVSLTLLNHDFGNEVLSREQLLRYVPIFVAALVWLTRILFIGAFSVAGEEVLGQARAEGKKSTASGSGSPRPAQPKPAAAAAPAPRPTTAKPRAAAPAPRPAAPPPAPARPQVTYEPVDDPVMAPTMATPAPMPSRDNSRIRQRPPVPGGSRVPSPGMQAQAPNRR